jgi:hypothetical protein
MADNVEDSIRCAPAHVLVRPAGFRAGAQRIESSTLPSNNFMRRRLRVMSVRTPDVWC